MPELPEVETIVRELNESQLIGRTIVEAKVFWARTVAIPKLHEFCDRLIGQKIKIILRRGKYIIIELSRDVLLIHLRMTGKLAISKNPQAISSHERVRLHLDDGRYLHFEDQRKFGKWYLLSDYNEKLDELGLEPFSKEFTLKALKDMLKNSSRSIKAFLLDQQYIAGIGNIYADEALWEAKIHPNRKADTLTPKEIAELFRAIPLVLKQGVNNMGTTLGSSKANYYSVAGRRGENQLQLKVFRREGFSCPRCHTKIIKIKAAQRGTHLCPHCQKNL